MQSLPVGPLNVVLRPSPRRQSLSPCFHQSGSSVANTATSASMPVSWPTPAGGANDPTSENGAPTVRSQANVLIALPAVPQSSQARSSTPEVVATWNAWEVPTPPGFTAVIGPSTA